MYNYKSTSPLPSLSTAIQMHSNQFSNKKLLQLSPHKVEKFFFFFL